MSIELVSYLAISTILVIFLLFIFFLTWQKTGVWFHPASLLAASWVIYTSIPLIVGTGYPLNPAGLVYITAFVSLFASSTFLFKWKPTLQRCERIPSRGEVLSSKFLAFTFWLLIASSLFLHAIDVVLQGFPLSTDILTIGGQYAERRYAGTLDANIYSKIALLASFQSAIVGGIIFGRKKNLIGKLFILAIAFLPSSAVMVFQSAKGLFFLSASFFAGGWLITRTYENDFHLPRIPIATGLIAFCLLFTLVLSSFVARFGFDIDLLRYYLASYSSGHLYAFSDWFSDRYFGFSTFDGYDQSSLEGGFYTFMGFFKAFGDTRPVPLGVFDEFFEVPGLLITNIYTVFRGLIVDFGLFGSLVFAAFIGLGSNLAFYNLVSRRNSPLSCTFFIFSVGLIYQSYIISSLTWISIPTSFLITYFILATNKIIWSRLNPNLDTKRPLIEITEVNTIEQDRIRCSRLQ